MRFALNALLAVVLVALALVGTAGLSSMHGDDHCGSLWPPAPGGPEFGPPSGSYISTWPPGLRCELLARDGTVTDREAMTATGFLALLALEIGLVALVLRARRRVPFWLRTAALATVGLLVWGVASLWYGPVAGLVGGAFFLGPSVGFTVDRLLRPRDALPEWTPHGLFGLVVVPCSGFLGLWVWLALGVPLAHALTVALIGAGAAVAARSARPHSTDAPDMTNSDLRASDNLI